MGLCSRTLALPKLFPPHALQFGWEMCMSTFLMESGLVNSTKRTMFSARCGASIMFGVLCWGPHRHDLYSWPCYNPHLQQRHTLSEGKVASPSGLKPSPTVRTVFWAYLLVLPRVHCWTTGPGLLKAIPRVLGHCLQCRKKGESRLMAYCIHRVVT